MTILTKAQALHDLLVDLEPDRVVIEICSIAGWVSDLVRTLEIELRVASTSDERWLWRKVKQKNDRREALKLAQPAERLGLTELYFTWPCLSSDWETILAGGNVARRRHVPIVPHEAR